MALAISSGSAMRLSIEAPPQLGSASAALRSIPFCTRQPLDDLRPDGSRADGVHPDVVRRQVERHATGHGGDRGFGGVVGDELRLGDEAGDRAQVDDGSAPGLADFRDHVLRDQRDADHVDIQDLPPLLDGGVNPPQDEDGGVVDEDVDLPEDFDGSGDHAHDAGFVSDVGFDEERLPAAGGDCRGRPPDPFRR